jgi:hypothetical protein
MPENDQLFCSDVAREHNVPLIGSATRGDLWFLVEYSGRWEGKAFEASAIPDQVKSYLKGLQTPGIKPRYLLIKQDSSRQREELHFFIGQTNPQSPRLYEYRLKKHTDILDIDLRPFADGEPGDPAFLRDQPLFLTCTNGKRDLCCTRYGMEIYQALTEEVGDAAWQTSHIGGHNKAPNNLFFPHGLNYGRATPAVIRQLAHDYQDNRVGLENLRGRVCFDPPVQAAEHFWRESTGILDLPGMQLILSVSVGENEWRIEVQGVDEANQQQFTIQRQESETLIPITCTHEKVRPISTYQRSS